MSDQSALASQIVSEEDFFKSSYSGSGSGSDCLEVALLAGGIRVRDSKNKRGPVLNFPSVGFQALLAAVKAPGSPLSG
ncbi:DUF397 domain-containing protein [Streptomyces sp. YIM B13518]|uniref:DUF397 domain-containing protein n=1 Tax=Streptomyces sp. YIM B13518 TaxID=3366316 RepID=UPI00368C3A76